MKVCLWPETAPPIGLPYVRYPGHSGKHMLVLGLTGSAPKDGLINFRSAFFAL
jgi:hypothetical protein